MNRSFAAPVPILVGSIQIGAESLWRKQPDFSARLRRRDEVRWECVGPGFSVNWAADSASHAARDNSLCVVWGAPRASTSASTEIAPYVATEQILDRLCARGTSALSEIRGGFGIFFVDSSNQRIILAVDRFAIETLCFAVNGNLLSISDRADCVPTKTRTLSPQSVYDYLFFHCIPSPATIFREITRLDHGSFRCFHRDGLENNLYWVPRFEERCDVPVPVLATKFRALVRESVALEASRRETLGCFLSGGTDSSTVAGMLGVATGRMARTYSIGFDAPGYDEMSYARIAAHHFGMHHREHYVTADQVVTAAPRIAEYLDQPFGNSSVVPAYFCAHLARADGVTRMLAGDGGDELFGGNTRYALQQFLDLYHRLPVPMREKLIEPLLLGRLGGLSIPGLKQAASYVRHSRMPMPDRMDSFNLVVRIGAQRILAPAILHLVDETGPLRTRRDTYAAARAKTTLNRMLFYDWKHTLADSDLPKVRSAVGLAGITVAYPLLADEIADFSLLLPTHFKVRRFKLRWFFKTALRGFLPDAIINKKKHGFGLPFGVWAIQHAPLRDLACDSLQALERRGYLRIGFRDELMRQLMPTQPSYYGELLWILMMLEQWLAAHETRASLIGRSLDGTAVGNRRV